jgi:hypothetical protein
MLLDSTSCPLSSNFSPFYLSLELRFISSGSFRIEAISGQSKN